LEVPVLKLIQASLLLALYFLVCDPAQANLLIEPVAGWNVPTKFTFQDNNYSGDGGSAGGRVGFQKLGFQLGVDYLHSRISFNETELPKPMSMNEWAIFAGFEFPILLRIYAGLIVSALAETKDPNGDKITLDGGTGAKFGVGFTGLPLIDINVEYRRGSWQEYKIGDTKTEEESNYNSILLAVSAPFNL
jgi:hypothetical protein